MDLNSEPLDLLGCKGCIPDYELVSQEGSLHMHMLHLQTINTVGVEAAVKSLLVAASFAVKLVASSSDLLVWMFQMMDDVSHGHDHMQSDALKAAV